MIAEPVELREPTAFIVWPLAGPVSADSVSVEASINRHTKVAFTALFHTIGRATLAPVFQA